MLPYSVCSNTYILTHPLITHPLITHPLITHPIPTHPIPTHLLFTGTDGYDSEIEELNREEEGELMQVRLASLDAAKDEIEADALRALLLKAGELDASQGGGKKIDMENMTSENDEVKQFLMARKVFVLAENEVFDELMFEQAKILFYESQQEETAMEQIQEFLNEVSHDKYDE